MAITYFNQYVLQGGTTALTMLPPASTAAGDLEIIYVANKNSSVTPTNPSGGWTPLDSQAVGTGADGVGTGQVRLTAWYRILSGTSTNTSITITGANRSLGGGMVYRKGGGDTWAAPTISFGSDTSSGTGFSAAMAANLGVLVGDFLLSVGVFTQATTLPGRDQGIPGMTFTSTGINSAGGATGNQIFIFTDHAQPSAGTQSGVSTTIATAGAATTGGALNVRVTLQTAIDLVLDNATQAHAAESLVLTQDHALAVDGASQALSSESPGLPQVHALSGLDAAQAQSSESPTLPVGLAVADASQLQAAQTPTLIQQHILIVDATSHAHVAGAVSLTQVHALAVDAAAQAHSVDAPALPQTHVLSVQPALHGQAAGNVTLDDAPLLAVSDPAQSQTSSVVSLTQDQQLAVASTGHLQVAGSPVLTQAHILAADSALQAVTSDSVDLTQAQDLAVQNAAHASTATSPTLATVGRVTFRPYIGTTTRPLTGVTARPYSGVIVRP